MINIQKMHSCFDATFRTIRDVMEDRLRVGRSLNGSVRQVTSLKWTLHWFSIPAILGHNCLLFNRGDGEGLTIEITHSEVVTDLDEVLAHRNSVGPR